MTTVTLKKSVSLFDATMIGVGATVGAGIYAVLGVAVGASGPAVVISVVVAALVAFLTALSFVQLSRKLTREGGVYAFAREMISPFAGFLTGFLWVISNVVVAAAVSLGFSYYFSVLTGLPVVPVAFVACLAATFLNYFGIKQVTRANNVLVAVKVLVLMFFVFVALSSFNAGRFVPFSPFGIGGILQGAAIMFFAYGGFARVTIIAEEVKDPTKTVPHAILLTLAISSLLYVLVAAAAVGVADYQQSSRSGAFLAAAITSAGVPYAGFVVSFGALVATTSVLLTSILGVSRVLFAMARNKEVPQFFSEINPSTGIPQNAVLFSGVGSALLALTGDLGLVASISSAALLAYYVVANYAALKLKHTSVPSAGILSCLVLFAFLPKIAMGLCAAALGAGTIYYFVVVVKRRPVVR